MKLRTNQAYGVAEMFRLDVDSLGTDRSEQSEQIEALLEEFDQYVLSNGPFPATKQIQTAAEIRDVLGLG